MAIRRPNLYDQVVGLAGIDETGDVGQQRVITRTGQEFTQGPTAPAQATGRFFNEARGVMDTRPTPAPTVLNATPTPTPATTPTPGPTTGGGFVSAIVPQAETISQAEIDRLARDRFLQDFGNDPDWQEKLAEYSGDIDAAYEAILGEEGPLAEGRRLAEETFRRQEENVQTGFRQSRQQLAEQAFLGERQLQQQLAARGLGGAGLAQLGGVQQQIAQGRQATGLFAEFTQSLENLAAAEAKSAQQFGEAEANLKLALGQQKISLKQQIDQQQQAYNQFKGQTVQSLREAIRSNNFQDYQLAVQDYQLLREQEQQLEQRRMDGLGLTTQLIQQTFAQLISQAETAKNLNDTERQTLIEQLQADQLNEINLAAQDMSRFDQGLAPASLVEDLYGRYDFATQPTARPEPAPTQNDVTGAGVTNIGPTETGQVEEGTYTAGQVGTNQQGELYAVNPDGRRVLVGEAAKSLGYQFKGLTEVPVGIELKVGNNIVTTTGKISEGGQYDRPKLTASEDGDIYIQKNDLATGYENRKVFVKDVGAWREISVEEAEKVLTQR